MKEIDPEAYHSNIESAMAEIPKTEMANFQKVFLCEMKKNNQSPNPRPIDAGYVRALAAHIKANPTRSEEHTSELQSLMRISYAVFCLKKKNTTKYKNVKRTQSTTM